jgi:hypothetical protein
LTYASQFDAIFGFSMGSFPEIQGDSPQPDPDFRPIKRPGFVPGMKTDLFATRLALF